MHEECFCTRPTWQSVGRATEVNHLGLARHTITITLAGEGVNMQNCHLMYLIGLNYQPSQGNGATVKFVLSKRNITKVARLQHKIMPQILF